MKIPAFGGYFHLCYNIVVIKNFMLKKILIVFIVLLVLLISILILINIFYPLDKSVNINYQTQATENKKTETPISNNATEVKTQLFTNKKFNYQFSVEKSMLCEYYDASGEALICKFNPKTTKQREDVFSIMINVSKNYSKSLEEATKQETEIQNDDYVKLKNPTIVTDEIIAEQKTKKIITEEIISGVDEWYIENYLLKYNNDLYSIEYFSETGSKKHLDAFYDLLDSFQFTK